MFKFLFLLFIVVPIVEIGILLQVSEVIGGWTTLLVVIATAFFGARLVKLQGLQTYQKIQQKSAQGQIPGEELFSGICILISGVLLLTPGIVTDVIGFLLLTPAVRKVMIKELKKRIHLFGPGAGQSQFFTYTSHTHYQQDYESQGNTFEHPNDDPDRINRPSGVIDGEFTRKD